MKNAEADELIRRAARSLRSVAPSLPTLETLQREIADGDLAMERGYFLPDEDERVRQAFAKYLGLRAALHQTIAELEPLIRGEAAGALTSERQTAAFSVAFASAAVLVRAATFLVDSFAGKKTAWRKLDEAEPRFGIPRKQFTRIYRSLTSPYNVWRIHDACHFAKERAGELARLADDPEMAPVLHILERNRESVDALTRASFARNQLKYRLHSLLRRQRSGFDQVMFALMEVSGRVVSEITNPFHEKRVTSAVIAKVGELLQPGDVIVTRHDDAMSNLFLPGFWPHGALYIGSLQERDALGVRVDDERRAASGDDVRVLEAKKDGVLFRTLEETLRVDSFVVIRPRLGREALAEALSRALTHAGKLYDFEFDFSRADRLVCTELIYRAYHGAQELRFSLRERAGRVCLSAEDLLDYAVEGQGFEVIAIYGVLGKSWVPAPGATQLLAASYRANR